MKHDEQIFTLALTRIPGLGQTGAFHLVKNLGSAMAVFQHRTELPQLIPGAQDTRLPRGLQTGRRRTSLCGKEPNTVPNSQ